MGAVYSNVSPSQMSGAQRREEEIAQRRERLIKVCGLWKNQISPAAEDLWQEMEEAATAEILWKEKEEAAAVTLQKEQEEAAAKLRKRIQNYVVALWKKQEKVRTEAMRKQQEEAAAAAVRKHQEEAAAAALRHQQEEAAAAALRKQQAEAAAAALRKQQKEAAAAALRKQQEEAAAAALRKQQEEATADALRKQQEEAAAAALQKQQVEAAVATLRKQLEEAAAAALRKQQVEAAVATVRKQLEEAAAAALRKQQKEAAAAALKKRQKEAAAAALKKRQEKAAAAALRKQQEEAAAAAFREREYYECPTCYASFSRGIYQCAIGHSSCIDCKNVGRACGICKSTLTDMRNFDLEHVISEMIVQCPNTSEGCKLYIKNDVMENHVKKCPFKERNCPLLEVFGTCHWKGKLSEISRHFESMHSDGRQTNVDTEMQLRHICKNTQQVHLIVLGVYNFLLHVKVSETDGNIYMAVQMIGGTKCNAQTWRYDILIYNKSDTRKKCMFTNRCRPSSDNIEDVFKAEECAVLPLCQADTFVCNGALTYKIFINRSNVFHQKNIFRKKRCGRGRNGVVS